MPRLLRHAPCDHFYHVLNRANARARIFRKDADYEAFEQVLLEALAFQPMRVLAYCVMPNHWHLVLWPRDDGDLSRFMQWLTLTHTQRWHAHRHTVGTGHLYQGRYKSFPIQNGYHLRSVLRYVERNPLRAKLVDRIEEWQWGSLWRRERGSADDSSWLQKWPGGVPENWSREMNRGNEAEEELRTIRNCVNRGRPYGNEPWQKRTAASLGLESTFRPRGRPRLDPEKGT